MSTKDDHSDSEFYDACGDFEQEDKLSDDDEDFVSIRPNTFSSDNEETKSPKFVPLHEELNQKLQVEEKSELETDVDQVDLEPKQDEDPFYIDENLLKQEVLTDEQKQDRLKEATENKQIGNDLFKQENYLEALQAYTKSLRICPLEFSKDRSVFYSNRSVCFFKINDKERCIAECTKSLELDPDFVKPLLRRAECYQTLDKLDEALEDYKKLEQLEPKSSSHKSKVNELEIKVKERNERLKDEMMGKLKDLGNLVLKPFGLSTENFQFVQDPNSGSYSVNFKK